MCNLQKTPIVCAVEGQAVFWVAALSAMMPITFITVLVWGPCFNHTGKLEPWMDG